MNTWDAEPVKNVRPKKGNSDRGMTPFSTPKHGNMAILQNQNGVFSTILG